MKEIKCAKRPKVDDVKKEDLCQPETSENTDDKLKCEEISGNAVNALDGCNLGNDLAICFENMDNVTYTIPEEFTEGINLDLFNKIDFQNTELDLQTSGIIKIQPNVPAGMEQEPPVKNVSPIIQNKLILDQSGGKKISILNGTENYLVQKNDVKVQKVKVRKSNSFSKPVRGFKKFYVPIQPKPVQPSDSNLKVHFGLDQSAILTRGVMKKNSRGSFCEYSQDLEGETITYFQNLDEPRLLPASILPENIGVVDNVIRINDYPRVVKLEDNAATKTLESIFQTSQNCLETPKVISQVENLSGITSLSSFEILGQQQQPPQPIQEIRNSGNSDKDKVSHLRLLLEKSIVPEIQNNGKNGGFIFEKPQPSDRQTMRCIVMAGNAGNVAANTVGFNIVADRKMPKLLMQRSKSAADKRVPQSSNTPKYLNFTPISPRPKSPLKAPIIPITSTFVSPRTTPVSRSRQNSISHEPFLLPKIPIDNDFKTERAGKGKLSNSQKSSLGENVPDYQKAPGLGRPRSNSSNFSRVRKNRSKVLSSGRDSIKPQPVQNGAVNIYSFPLPPPGQGVYLDPVSNEVRNLIANPTIIQSANSRSQSVPLNYVIGDGSWFSQQVTPIYGQYLNPENPELNGSEIKEFSGLKTEPKNLEPLIPDEQIPLSLDQMDEVFTGDSQDINSLVQKIGNELFGSNFENNTSNNNNNSNNADTTNKDNFIQNNAFVQENIFSDKIDLNSDGTFSEVFPGEPDSLICEDMKPYLQTFEGNDDEGSKEKIKLFGNMFDSGNDNANDPLINSFKPTFMGEITTCPNSPVLGLFGSKYNEDSQLIEFLGLNG